MRLARGSNQIENLQITNSHINITFQSTFNSTTSGDSSSQARSFSSIFPHNVLHTPLHSFNISLDIRGLLTIQLIGEKTKKKLGLGLWRCLLITCLRIYALFKNMYLCIYIYISICILFMCRFTGLQANFIFRPGPVPYVVSKATKLNMFQLLVSAIKNHGVVVSHLLSAFPSVRPLLAFS